MRKFAIVLVLTTIVAGMLSGCTDALIAAVREDVERATAPQEPTIEILRGATVIADGSSVDFGSQPSASVTDITFLIKNTGTGNLLLGSVGVDPSSESNGFSVGSLSGTSIAAGASVNLMISFAPASGAVYNADVTVPSNALNDTSIDFSITGTGVVPDTTPPTGTVSIAGGAVYTQSANVTLTLSASDTGGGTVTHMEIKNESNAFTGNWETYTTSKAWTLEGVDGTKTVYVRYRDNSGNISSTSSDTIILDTVYPTISSRMPGSGAVNQTRTVNAVVNFSESMNQATMTTSTVYLRIKGGATVATAMTKAATSVTLNPTADLLYGYDYQIVWTAGLQDLSGRSVTASTSDFTVERDYWEGANGNEAPANAFDVTVLNSYSLEDNWIDFVPDIQDEAYGYPIGIHSKLALLETVDYYVVDIPEGMSYLDVRVFFTTDEVNGTTVDTTGTESIVMGVIHNGHGMGGYQTTQTDLMYDRWHEYDISNPVANGGGIYTILIYETSSNYANRRKYNLRVRYGTGM